MVGVDLGGNRQSGRAVGEGTDAFYARRADLRRAHEVLVDLTRGLVEMARLGEKLGAKVATFSGLTGMGDLIVTCTSPHSRNNRFGKLIGGGCPVEEALNRVGTVEGYFACKAAYTLAQKHNVNVPIIELCHKLLYENYPVEDIVKTLMLRPFKEE